MIFSDYRTRIVRSAGIIVFLIGFTQMFCQQKEEILVTLHTGQSEILDFILPVKRIAISNPDVAKASVISPTQILLDGKETGITSLVVWPERGDYIKRLK